MLLSTIYHFLVGNIFGVAIIGGLFGGFEVLVLVSLLASTSLFNLVVVFFICLAGMIFMDLVLFSLGKMKFLGKLKNISYFKKCYEKVDCTAQNIIRRNYFKTFLFAKLARGISPPLIVYIGRKSSGLKKFLLYNILVNGLLVLLAMLIGWGIRNGIEFLVEIYENFFEISVIATLLVVFFFSVDILIRKRFQKSLRRILIDHVKEN